MVGVRYFGSVSKRLHVCQDKNEKESHVSTERGEKSGGVRFRVLEKGIWINDSSKADYNAVKYL